MSRVPLITLTFCLLMSTATEGLWSQELDPNQSAVTDMALKISLLNSAALSNFDDVKLGPCRSDSIIIRCNSAIKLPQALDTTIVTDQDGNTRVEANLYSGIDSNAANRTFNYFTDLLKGKYPNHKDDFIRVYQLSHFILSQGI